MSVMKTHGAEHSYRDAMLLAGFVFLTLFAGCNRETEQTVYIPGGYKRVPPEKIPANIDARLLRPWEEESQFLADGSPVKPSYPITRFWFCLDGRFGVNWRVFEEGYWEYQGDYTVDQTTGVLVLRITGGNDIPADFQGRGKYHFDNEGRLCLSDIWLGTPKDHPAASQPATSGYGHRFRDSGNYAAPEADQR